MKKPTLSVLVPNYNHSMYIGEALDAILGQSFVPLEIIVSDHSSTDNSVEIIESYVKKYQNVRMITTRRNVDLVQQANNLASLAKGEYLYFAAADDKVLPGFFEKSMNLLAQYLEAGLCCSDPLTFDDQTGKVNENKLYLSKAATYFSPPDLLKVMQRRSVWIAGHTSVVKRPALLEAGGFIPELRWHCDWFALLVIAFRYGICYIPEPLAALRTSRQSYSASGGRKAADQHEVLRQLLLLLQSAAYRDVRPAFERSRALLGFGRPLLHVMLRQPEFRRQYLPRLLVPILMYLVKGRLYRAAPGPVKRLYRRLRDRPPMAELTQ